MNKTSKDNIKFKDGDKVWVIYGLLKKPGKVIKYVATNVWNTNEYLVEVSGTERYYFEFNLDPMDKKI